VDFAGGKTWYRWVNYVPPDKGGLQGLATAWQRRYSPAAPDKVSRLMVLVHLLVSSTVCCTCCRCSGALPLPASAHAAAAQLGFASPHISSMPTCVLLLLRLFIGAAPGALLVVPAVASLNTCSSSSVGVGIILYDA
jgi:hypothetical protein